MTPTEVAALATQGYQAALALDAKYGCSPACVPTAVQETVGEVSDAALAPGAYPPTDLGAFGGNICCALSSGLLVLGSGKARRAGERHPNANMAGFQAGLDLVRRFRAEFGAITCEQLSARFDAEGRSRPGPHATGPSRPAGCAHAAAAVTQWVIELL